MQLLAKIVIGFESRGAFRKQILDEPQNYSPWKIDNYVKENRLVIADKDCQVDIIHDIHKGSDDTSHSKAMLAYLGGTPTYEKLATRFFWYGIGNNVADYIQKCDRC